MNTESEFILEDKLIAQLVELGYESVRIDDEAMMLGNLKRQLEIHNEVTLSEAEFALVLNHLNNGSVFERAKRHERLTTLNFGSNFYFGSPVEEPDWRSQD